MEKIKRKTRREQTTQDNFSPIDPLAPNYHKYPQSKHASLIKCILNPGDALYMPSFTWHNVVSEGEDNKNDIHIGGINMGVNVWFGGDKRFQIVIEAIIMESDVLITIWNRMSMVMKWVEWKTIEKRWKMEMMTIITSCNKLHHLRCVNKNEYMLIKNRIKLLYLYITNFFQCVELRVMLHYVSRSRLFFCF